MVPVAAGSVLLLGRFLPNLAGAVQAVPALFRAARPGSTACANAGAVHGGKP
jgi:hypothetical protein